MSSPALNPNPALSAPASRGFDQLSPLFLLGSVLLLIFGTGCVSQSESTRRAQAAFFQGQAAGRQLQSLQAAGPAVAVVGPVVRHEVAWHEELTLAEALATARYTGAIRPISILIHRSGESLRVPVNRLLSGADNPLLEPGDVVEIQ